MGTAPRETEENSCVVHCPYCGDEMYESDLPQIEAYHKQWGDCPHWDPWPHEFHPWEF